MRGLRIPLLRQSWSVVKNARTLIALPFCRQFTTCDLQVEPSRIGMAPQRVRLAIDVGKIRADEREGCKVGVFPAFKG